MQEKSKMHRPNIPYRDRLSVGATLAVAPIDALHHQSDSAAFDCRGRP